MMGYVTRQHLEQLRTQQPQQYNQLITSNLLLGEHPESHDLLFLPEVDRFSGAYIIGQAGYGKSSLIENMFQDDALKNHAIILIDPHGDLIDHCIAQLPEHRVAHTYVLDMRDKEYPFGVNMFSHGKLTDEDERMATVNRITHIFQVLWPETERQVYLKTFLRMAVMALLETPGATLVDLLKFLDTEDGSYRAGVLSNPALHYSVPDYWQREYDSKTPKQRYDKIEPLMQRLYQLFMGRSLVQNIVGQRKTSISFRQAILNGEIILVRLPLKQYGDDAKLVGQMVVAQVHAALFSAASLPEDKRRDFALYVDEFEHFVTQDIVDMVQEGRKYKVKLTMAHQTRGQLKSDDLQRATMGTLTKITMQVIPDDAREMAPVYPIQNDRIEPNDYETKACAHLLEYGADAPHVRKFIEYYLRPLHRHRKGKKIVIETAQWTPMTGLDFIFKGNVRENFWEKSPIVNFEQPEVDDPVVHLDPLFLEVMRRRSAQMAIPPGCVEGFANAGHGFYQQAKRAYGKGQLNWGGINFGDMVVWGDNRNWWIREPVNSDEQFRHFMYYLRETMIWLAANPVGTIKKTTATDVAVMLGNQPKRHAYVHSDRTIGTMRTFDTPQRLTGAQLEARIKRITDQTRAKYCHPRQEIEQRLGHEPATAPLVTAVPSGAPAGSPAKLQPGGRVIAGWGEADEP